MSTKGDIKRQIPVEAQIARYICFRENGGFIEFPPDGYCLGYDFIHYDLNTFIPHYYEVKNDEESVTSTNLFFEYRNSKLDIPSGLAATKADTYVHIAPPDMVFLYDPKTMLEYLRYISRDWPQKCKTVYSAGDDNSDGYLVKIKHIEAITLTYTDKVDWLFIPPKPASGFPVVSVKTIPNSALEVRRAA